MEIACHDSYPRNSENASPPGTFTVYLSLSCVELAKPPKTASHTVAIPIVSMLLRFIAVPPESRLASSHLSHCSIAHRVESDATSQWTHRTILEVMNSAN